MYSAKPAIIACSLVLLGCQNGGQESSFDPLGPRFHAKGDPHSCRHGSSGPFAVDPTNQAQVDADRNGCGFICVVDGTGAYKDDRDHSHKKGGSGE